MSYAPWTILLAALAAMTAGVSLLFVGDAADGVRLTGLLVVAGGVALLVLWAKINGRRHEIDQAVKQLRPDPTEQALFARKRRSVRFFLLLVGVLLIPLGVIQGVSGQVYIRATRQSIDPAEAWFVGGCMIILGSGVVGTLGLAQLLSGATRQPGEGQEKAGVVEGPGVGSPDGSASRGGET